VVTAVALAAVALGAPVQTLPPIGFGLEYRNAHSSQSQLTFAGGPRPVPAVTARLGVLRAPATARDALPRIVSVLLSQFGELPVPAKAPARVRIALAHASPGRAETEKARLVAGTAGMRIWAVPTSHGGVVLATYPVVGAQTVRALSDGLVWLSLSQSAGRTLVYGLVADRVAAVAVETSRGTRRARVGRNGFALGLPDVAAKQVEALLVTTRDGSRFRLPLDRKEFRR
jgi:hypothetical protein